MQLQGLLGVLRVRGEGPVARHQLGDEAEGPLSRQMRTTPLSIKRVRAHAFVDCSRECARLSLARALTVP